MRRIGILVCALLAIAAECRAELPVVLKNYVEEAGRQNIALAQKSSDLDWARARLDEARSAYQPRIDLVARYTLSDGGRTIDFPTGDLLNGVYKTLNDYLVANGKPASFPQISNQSISLLRPHEQETKVRLLQPLWKPEISALAHAGRWAAEAQEAQVSAYRRELRLAVCSAYFNYLEAHSAVAIFKSAQEVTAEAVRVNRVLEANDKVTHDRVLRAEADHDELVQQGAEAESTEALAKHYFNFLLNRDLEADIQLLADNELESWVALEVAAQKQAQTSFEAREELASLESAVKAAQENERSVGARSYPTLGLAVEAGIQGENYSTRSDARYAQGSLVAELNLWDGHQRRSQLTQAKAERRKLELEKEAVYKSLQMAWFRARDDLRTAELAHTAAKARATASAEAFRLVEQRSREGLANQLDFTLSRAEATRAALNRSVALAKWLTAAAAFDRASALSPL